MASTHKVTKPTLIHLSHSSSQNILWLLEELGVDYDVVLFDRPDKAPAPADQLRKTHPQAKSPQLLLPDGRVITQNPAITLYLLETYDTPAHRFRPAIVRPSHGKTSTAAAGGNGQGTEAPYDVYREETLCCIAASDISAKMTVKFLLMAATVLSPFFIRPILRPLQAKIDQMAIDPDVDAILKVLEKELDAPAGVAVRPDWYSGRAEPGRADFTISFYLDLLFQAKIARLDDYPNMKAWTARRDAREPWKRSLQKGNGYNLDFPSKW